MVAADAELEAIWEAKCETLANIALSSDATDWAIFELSLAPGMAAAAKDLEMAGCLMLAVRLMIDGASILDMAEETSDERIDTEGISVLADPAVSS